LTGSEDFDEVALDDVVEGSDRRLNDKRVDVLAPLLSLLFKNVTSLIEGRRFTCVG
jgi:type IV secretory pathway VirB4 component